MKNLNLFDICTISLSDLLPKAGCWNENIHTLRTWLAHNSRQDYTINMIMDYFFPQ